MNEATQKGYSNAYNSAFDMFTSDEKRLDDSNRFAADFGLQELGAETDMYDNQLRAGEMERGITSEGLAADYAQRLPAGMEVPPLAERDHALGHATQLLRLRVGGLDSLVVQERGDHIAQQRSPVRTRPV